MRKLIKTKKTRQRKRNTSSMTAKSTELNMSKLESEANPAAKFLLRALQELHLVDDTITVEDLQTVADEVMKDMDLMIGSEEFLRDLFDVTNQVVFHKREAYYKTVNDLSEKITQSQINLAKKDRDFPF